MKLWLVVAVLLASGLCACGKDCVSLCEDRKVCADATAAEKDANCAQSCDAVKAKAEATGCSSQYNSLIGCSGKLDVCGDETLDSCPDQAASWVSCVDTYCAAHPTDPACKTS